MTQQQHGFTLIELILFIVIMGILSASILTALNQVLLTYAQPTKATIAMQLAKTRMELILAERKTTGFTSFTDPCVGGSPPAVCTAPSGYTVTATISNLTLSSDPNFKQIDVNVSGDAIAILNSFVGEY